MRMITVRREPGLSRALILLVLAAAGTWGGLWLLARTTAVRDLAAGRIAARTGLDVVIGESRLGWPLDLVLHDIRTAGAEVPDAPGLTVGELRVGWWRYWRVVLDDPALRLRRSGPDLWEPAALAPLAELRQASAREWSQWGGHWSKRLRLHVEGAGIQWLDPDGRPEAALRHIHFRMDPLRLPDGHRLAYYRLKIYAGTGGAMGDARHLDWAWLASPQHPYLELKREARFPDPDIHDPGIHGLEERHDQ